ncbi:MULTISPECIES: alpha/beta hydrolase [Paenibacillus]|jgi:phospholipase/carboxylesterase|uniref:Phospholipase/Carboxylesterase n=2 Tax=Paenibacillus lactis TaxID=228574 RepID=G4HNJ5_9BACL|nr:alpha/beta hydrolase [Paenibacillus lactis]EHB50160.1 phospholipase/Carboxylesterase [Paenibacillus lactis 154]MBP1896384.1 phospholipase/carboxylesterase [Paenibacillus lactis]MCM3497383.1 alpha/beta hydrolase [Paenibacillus lactis]HAG01043.1 carboxylesterase [Paenibacillus lactis]
MEHQHIYRKGTSAEAPTLLLLHGTGGNEEDLLPLAEMVSPASNVLGVRGNVLENGMPRFFRRLAEGVFDVEDLVKRTQELHAFLDWAAEKYEFDRSRIVAIGYSNGANIAASLLFDRGDALQGAILHHPMVPLRDKTLPDLSGVPVFIAAGRRDPICPPQETEDLNELLSGAGADVKLHWENGGHQLSRSEVGMASSWFKEKFLQGEQR